jgi:hypothetical protein
VYKIAFYKLENYHQCPLRVVLMEHFGYKGKLFLPQFIGLIAHEYYERLIGRWSGFDEPFSLDEVVEKIIRDREPVFSIEEGLKAWENQPRDLWEQHLLRLLEGEQKGVFRREYEGWKPLSDNVVLHGFCDIFIDRGEEKEIIDLKFTRKKHRYNYNQLMIYSHLFDAQKVSFLFFEPNGDVEKRTIEVKPNNAKLSRLLGEMRWLAERIGKQNFSGFRPKHGSTCHPNRCAMWDYCPAVQIGKDGVYREEHSEWEGLEAFPAEDELCFDEE